MDIEDFKVQVPVISKAFVAVKNTLCDLIHHSLLRPKKSVETQYVHKVHVFILNQLQSTELHKLINVDLLARSDLEFQIHYRQQLWTHTGRPKQWIPN